MIWNNDTMLIKNLYAKMGLSAYHKHVRHSEWFLNSIFISNGNAIL